MNILFFVICLLCPVYTTLYNTDDDQRVDGKACVIGPLSLSAGDTRYSNRPCVKAQCIANPPQLIITGCSADGVNDYTLSEGKNIVVWPGCCDRDD
uniref:Single domain-containing protein n=1 Tax=Amblyomma maculatum TaxID=34609 RepID=G3MST5_AMBMU